MLAKSLLFLGSRTNDAARLLSRFVEPIGAFLVMMRRKGTWAEPQTPHEPWTRPRLLGLLFFAMRSFLEQAEMQNWPTMCLSEHALS